MGWLAVEGAGPCRATARWRREAVIRCMCETARSSNPWRYGSALLDRGCEREASARRRRAGGAIL